MTADERAELIEGLRALVEKVLSPSDTPVADGQNFRRAVSPRVVLSLLSALDEANGLTNYVEDRPESRGAEKRLDAIQSKARSLAAKGSKAMDDVPLPHRGPYGPDDMEEYGAACAAAERARVIEECARVCDDMAAKCAPTSAPVHGGHARLSVYGTGKLDAALLIGETIRALAANGRRDT